MGVEDVADRANARSNRFNIKVNDHSGRGADATLDVCTKTPQEKLAWIAAVHRVAASPGSAPADGAAATRIAEKTARVVALCAQLADLKSAAEQKPTEGHSTLGRLALALQVPPYSLLFCVSILLLLLLLL